MRSLWFQQHLQSHHPHALLPLPRAAAAGAASGRQRRASWAIGAASPEGQCGGGAGPRTMATTTGKIRRASIPLLGPPCGPPGTHFRVMQWNVLADGLAQYGDFVRVSTLQSYVAGWVVLVPEHGWS